MRVKVYILKHSFLYVLMANYSAIVQTWSGKNINWFSVEVSTCQDASLNNLIKNYEAGLKEATGLPEGLSSGELSSEDETGLPEGV